MVEVKFDFPDADKFSKDHFLSLRIGDVQRLGRLSSTRSFKFPASAVGTRKYGKVEVYRRVGGSPISIDPALAAGANEVDVTLDAGAVVSLIAQVSTTDAKGLQKEKQAEMASSPKGMADSPSHKVVTDYLNKHHLEVRLSDAMQKVLRERPEDPAKALAELLLSNGDKVAKLPVAPPLPAAPEFPAYERAEKLEESAPMKSCLPAQAAAREASVPKPAPERAAARLLPSMGSFHGAAGEFGGIVQVPKAAAAAAAAAPPAPSQQGFLPSMGSFHGPAAPFGGTSLIVMKAQVAPAASAAPQVAPRAVAVRLLPSMGACQNPVALYGGTVRIGIETPRFPSSAPPMKLPSVGTWLAFLPFDNEPGEEPAEGGGVAA